ncbi:hypothetical protein RGI92_002338 [Serratia marcescens]
MARMNDEAHERVYVLKELRYYAALGGLALMAPLSLTTLLWLLPLADVDNPQLVKAQGVSGLGLRFLDAGGEDVRLGSRGKPLWLTPGSDTLTYQVAPERTAAPLMAGSYRAVVDSSLSYD